MDDLYAGGSHSLVKPKVGASLPRNVKPKGGASLPRGDLVQNGTDLDSSQSMSPHCPFFVPLLSPFESKVVGMLEDMLSNATQLQTSFLQIKINELNADG